MESLRELISARSSVDPDDRDADTALRAALVERLAAGRQTVVRVGPTSPAALIDAILPNDIVRPIGTPERFEHRCRDDRGLWALIDSECPDVPLSFVSTAFCGELPDSVDALLDPSAPILPDADRRVCCFWSIISPTQALRGVPTAATLLHELIDELGPDTYRYVTLSPIPSLRDAARLAGIAGDDPDREIAGGFAAWWLTRPPSPATDPVARFHLRNGARVERICPTADLSERAVEQSWGVGVNYLYEPARLAARRAEIDAGRVATSSEVRELSRRYDNGSAAADVASATPG